MVPRHRDDFNFRKKRQEAGLRPGERDSTYYDARIRWTCPGGLCPEVSTWAHDHSDLYASWPHRGDSNHACARAVMYLFRNGIESVNAGLKLNGLGVMHMRPLWARDAEAEFFLGLHLLLVTARRMTHETGVYQVFLDEYLRLGLDREGYSPDPSLVEAVHAQRPPELQWDWPDPARAAKFPLSQADAA